MLEHWLGFSIEVSAENEFNEIIKLMYINYLKIMNYLKNKNLR